MGEGEKIWYVTGNLTMNYLKPTPIVSDIEVWAEITKIEGRKTHMKCHVQHENHVTVEALVVGIQVPLSWLEEQSQLAQSSCV